jgi:hypothetical protein
VQGILASAGVRGLYFGMPAMLLQTSCKLGIRFAAFESVKPLVGVGAAGLAAGAIESFWVAPCERLKTLRQVPAQVNYLFFHKINKKGSLEKNEGKGREK